MRTRTTTDLDIIRHSPNRFTWGKVTKIHDIGRYTIVEAVYDTPGKESEVGFYVYVDGGDCRHGTETLDQALVLAIALGNMPVNEANHMAQAACKVLNIK